MEKNLLYFMMGNVDMAKVSTKELIDITPYMDFRNELMDDLSEYEKFYNRIEELKQEDEKLKGLSPLAEGSTKMSIMFKTMTDKSRQNMSEMLVKGFDMGIKDIDENIAKAVAVKERPQVIQLARDYRMHMVKNREKYLKYIPKEQ
jgi:hypothetical protein